MFERTVSRAAAAAAVGCVGLLFLLLPLTTQAQDLTFRPEDLMGEDLTLHLRSGGSQQTTCVMPNGQPGVCGSAISCPPYLPLLKDLRNKTVIAFFRERVCRQGEGFIHLCCSTQNSMTQAAQATPATTIKGSPIFFLQPGGSSLVLGQQSQGANARRPVADGSLADSRDESDGSFKVSTTPSQGQRPQGNVRPQADARPQLPVRPQTNVRPSTPRPSQPPSSVLPQFQTPAPQQPTTHIPPTIMMHDREIPVQGTFNPTTSQAAEGPEPTEPIAPRVLPSEGECGATRQTGAGSTMPWVVAVGVLQKGSFQVICGGSLISRQHVLISAHCVQPSRLTHVRLGELGGRDQVKDVPIMTTTQANYNPSTRENDLALITLSSPVTFSDNIRPACLPFPYRLDGFQGQPMKVVGYGDSGRLEEGAVQILGLTQCKTSYQSPGLVSNSRAFFSRLSDAPSNISPRAGSRVVVDRRNLCGEPAPSSSTKTCLSEHGAPLFYHDQDTTGLHFLVGLSSLGEGCQAGPGVYTRVGAFIPWLVKQLSGVDAGVLDLNPANVGNLQPINRRRG